MRHKKSLLRFYLICGLFVGAFFVFILKLLSIYFFQSQYLTKLAAKQRNLYVEIPPQRGIIYDRRLKPLSTNKRSYSVFAVPGEIQDKEKASDALSLMLGLENNFVLKRISKDKHFVWIKRKISDDATNKLRSANLNGIFFIKESKRSYPNGYLAANILGFTNVDNEGLEGFELSCDKYLKGRPGYAFFLRDARQNVLRLENTDKLPLDGYDIVLTIDEVIQYFAEAALDEAFRKYNAQGACVIVMDPFSGRILALANRPTFDANLPQNIATDMQRNRAVCDFFEPGSVFKIITASAALEENMFKEDDKIFCENGEYKIANHTLHDHKPHGWLTFREVISLSSNIGVSKIAQELGLEKIFSYAKAFGFGDATGIKLPGETSGILKPMHKYSKTSIGALPMGQEVAVTALQLSAAISVIANGGLYYRPYIVDKIQDKFEEPIKQFHPQSLRRVISYKTAQRVKNILKEVVENGTGKMAKSKEYAFAGKTGTAQKVDPAGGYSHKKFYASFIGFAPADNPRLAIVVVFDEPHPYHYGGVVAAPVFKQIAEKSLKYIEVNEKLQPFLKVARTHED